VGLLFQRCSGVTGELADQLTALKALQEELTADRTTSFQTAAAACAEAGIVTNSHTRENRHSLTGRWEQLRKVRLVCGFVFEHAFVNLTRVFGQYVKQSVQAVEGQMLAAKAGDLTVEQVQEMKEVCDGLPLGTASVLTIFLCVCVPRCSKPSMQIRMTI